MLFLGSLIIALALLVFVELCAVFHRLDSPSWTKSNLVGEMIAVGFVTLVCLGAGCLINGAADMSLAESELLDLAAALLVVAATVVVWRRRWRGRQAQAQPSAASPQKPDEPSFGSSRPA